jgi:hypothetical protein
MTTPTSVFQRAERPSMFIEPMNRKRLSAQLAQEPQAGASCAIR